MTNRNADRFKNISHIIIDEVHERGRDTDILLIAVKEELKNNKNMKVILMSATINATKFSEYFDHCIVINIPAQTFEVYVFHLSEILTKTNYAVANSTDGQNELSAERKKIDNELLVHVIAFIHVNQPKDGAILVFLPGYKEIIDQSDLIKQKFESMQWNDYRVMLLHSNMEDGNVFECMPEGTRKIILSTNIAETSITIDDVVHVIDVGLVKENIYDPSTGSMCLVLTKISKASARQRCGRAGRTRMGFCYRLYSQDEFESFKEYGSPEIKRIALTEISLKAKMLAPNQPIIEFLQQAIDPPPIDNLRQSLQLLEDIGALNSNGEITNLGYQVAHMPVDCQLGKMVLCAIFLKCVDPILTIASALSMKEPFLMTSDVEARNKLNKVRREFAYDALSDHKMLLNIYDAWKSSDNRRKFCSENSISNAIMFQMQGVKTLLERHIMERHNSDKVHLNSNALKWDVVKACIVAGLNRKFFSHFLFLFSDFSDLF